MKRAERECLVIVLAATAGSTDAWSYFGLGHVFIANLTGNTVLLGVALSRGRRAEVERPLLAIASYVLGVFAGTVLLETVFARWSRRPAGDAEQVWPRRISWTLGAESLLLTVAAIIWARHGPGTPWLRHGLVVVAAIALGLQSAAVQSLKVPGIATTYITGTWTTLVAALGRRATGRLLEKGPQADLRLQAAVLAAYCASAAFSGVLFRVWAPGLGVLPAAAAAGIALYGAADTSGR